MPNFQYKGYDAKGVSVSDTMAARSKEAALEQLNELGLLVTNISTVKFKRGSSAKVKNSDFIVFNQELLALIKAGIPLVDALKMCLPRPKKSSLNSILQQVHQRLLQGKSFSQAIADFPDVFDKVYLSSIQISEQTGSLETALIQYLDYLSKKVEIASKIKQALVYPAFLLTTLIGVMGVLFIFVVPSFSELYEDLGAELPVATQIILNIATVAPHAVIIIILVIVLLTITGKSLELSPTTKVYIDKALNDIPMTGRIRQGIQQSRILRMLDGLLASGSPLVASLNIVSDSFSNTFFGYKLKLVAEEVKGGGAFSISLDKHRFLPEQHLKMIHIGENSGSLADMMANVATYMESQVESQLKAITTLFEPIVMLLLGLLTGAIIISMYLPIFYLAEVVG